MGSASSSASLNERPPHPVRFTYDYFIDACEVTQGEYKDLMGTNPSAVNAGAGAAGIGDSFPVYYVRWYDAALFCNAKSKRNGYDTVYSYTAACGQQQSCPYVLENLTAHYERMGYRLPTEAEWEYACRAGAATDFFWGPLDTSAAAFAWYFANAQDQVHPVGRTRPNAFGLFDMCGNVAEWVGDWLGAYADSLSENPVGPANLPLEVFESGWQRPIRGGCYSLGTSFLRSSNRSGPYAVAAATQNKYTGFRTAMGAFFPDMVAGKPPGPVDSGSASLDCQKSDVLSFVGTWRIKIGFVTTAANGGRQLWYIDFADPRMKVRQLPDSVPANRPVISPNGAYIACSSKREGFTGASTITVRRLDSASTATLRTSAAQGSFLPRWFVDPASLDTSIVYVNGASMNNLPAWPGEQTLRQKFAQFSFAGQPQVVCSRGSFHGGMSRDGQFLATGYPAAFVYDTRKDRVIRYFLPPFSGRDDTAQVCNVTITPSLEKPDEIMFLDFGYPRTSFIVGKPYGFHSIIFVANSNTQAYHHVTKWFEAPAGCSSWDNVSWSNHPNFAIAVGNSSANGTSGSLFLIDIKDSLYLKVVTGDGLADPALWIDPRDVSELPDPYADFGMYNIPSYGISQLTLDEELHFFWSHRESVQCGFVGSSVTGMDVDPSLIRSAKTALLSAPGLEFVTALLLMKNYLLPSAPGLKVIGMSLDPGWIPEDYTAADPHGLGLVSGRGFQFDKVNDFWRSGVPPAVQAKIGLFNGSSWPDFDSSGALRFSSAGTGWGLPLYDGGDYAMADTSVQTYLSLMAAFADTLANRGVHFLLVKFPENPAYAATAFAGRYGPAWATYNQLVAWLRQREQQNPFFHFYDANMNGAHDYSSAEASDCNHLNALGRAKMSSRLDSVLSAILVP
jgi:formylglycine-generating enzyme required for sulfatase activity